MNGVSLVSLFIFLAWIQLGERYKLLRLSLLVEVWPETIGSKFLYHSIELSLTYVCEVVFPLVREKTRFSKEISKFTSADCRKGGHTVAFLLPTSTVVLFWSFHYLGSDFLL